MNKIPTSSRNTSVNPKVTRTSKHLSKKGTITQQLGNKKTTITLALDEKILHEIKRESESQGLSVNSKINSILSKHVNFFRYASEVQCLTVTHKMWIEILEVLDEELFIKLFENEAEPSMIALLTLNNIAITKENLIRYVYSTLALWSGMYTYFSYYNDVNGNTVLVFNHRYGLKWSRILSAVFSNTFQRNLGYQTKGEINQNIVKLTLIENHSLMREDISAHKVTTHL
jgi:predicted DNA binding CopG/RHH family protein